MNSELLQNLLACETDIDGAMHRLSCNEAQYISYLEEFLDDHTMFDLELALNSESWDEAFTAAHALKGLAVNMGFVPLFHATAELVVLIRAGRVADIPTSTRELKRCYIQITAAIRKNLSAVAE